MSNRLDKVREDMYQPKRIHEAYLILQDTVGVKIISRTDTEIKFVYKNSMVKFFPYSGWHTGKGIQDGRGLNNLLKQLQ